uniref:UspA domain protein n=1 Tax=Caulobacter sp. (strain K31) TaxID=366602 RepID=B0T0N0_CAUSK
MVYRDIQILAEDSPAGAARAAVAGGLAAHWGGRLTGLFPKTGFPPDMLTAEGMGYLPPQTFQTMIDEQAQAIDQAAAKAQAVFEAAAKVAGVAAEWAQVETQGADLIERARCADLLVMAPTARTCLGGPVLTAASIAMANGGPVLVTPETAEISAVGQRVLIAWNGSREAARALRDAGPFLARAGEIHVLTIAHGSLDEGPHDQALRRRLEPYYAKTTFSRQSGQGGADSEILRRHVKALGADLVVMGLFGHARLREWVLGGVSQDLLVAPPAALLISH